MLAFAIGSLNAGRDGVQAEKNLVYSKRFETSYLVQKLISRKCGTHARHRAYTLINVNELTENDIQLLQKYRQTVVKEYKLVVQKNSVDPSPLFKFFGCCLMPYVDGRKIKQEGKYIQEVSFLRQLLGDEKK